MKRFLKGISIMLIAALVATAGSVSLLPGKDSLADIEATPLEGTSSINIEPGPWKFSNALNGSATFGSPVTSGDDTTFVLPKGFNWKNGEQYDITVKLTNTKTVTGSAMSFTAVNDSSNTNKPYFTIRNSPNTTAYSVDYEITLKYPSDYSDASKRNIEVPWSDVPFIVGACYTSPNELNTIYSEDNTLYTKIPKDSVKYYEVEASSDVGSHKDDSRKIENWNKPASGKTYSGFAPYSKTNYNTPDNYWVGVGHNGNSVKGGYVAANGNKHALELRVGFRSYAVYFDSNDNNTSVPQNGTNTEQKDNPWKDVPQAYHTEVDPTHPILYWTADRNLVDKSITPDTTKIQTSQLDSYLATLKGEDIIKKGNEDPRIRFTAHIASRFVFDTQAAAAGVTGAPSPATQGLKDVGDKATSPTDLKPGMVFNGKKFVGWYTDASGTTPFNFDTRVVQSSEAGTDITIFGKWETINPEDTITIDFNLNDGGANTATNKPDNQQYEKPSTGNFVNPEKPNSTPARPGYTFKGWAETTNGTPKTDITTDKVNNNKTYYAIWEKNKSGGGSTGGGGYVPSSTIPEKKYKVEFETPFGPKPDTQSGIKSGGTVSDPINTLKPGYTTEDGHVFEGWYLDEACTIPYDFNSAVSKDIVLYAKWETATTGNVPTETPNAPVVKVEFETEIGETPATQVEVPGNTATDPGAPMDLATLKPGTIINGYRFEGWYLDKDYTIKYNFDTPLTEDIVLYAKWASVGLAKSPKTEDAALPLGVGVASALLLALSLFALSGKRRKDMK